ncbi:MAG: alpha-glucosidase C-terminal domain-containing protein [Gammaproteobacteria bacterium]|nr:alpha-glucosidase C-terminal domain-containing protein [Gammaproteobacteria bacterium]MBL7000642.1 alpha-glucosidase C-terminal domain-containing protein [Gammaproteobacteria bacterium]
MKKRLLALREKLNNHIRFIYPEVNPAELTEQLIAVMDLDSQCQRPKAHQNHWSQRDVIAISYGDSISRADEKPLQTLHQFFNQHFSEVINSIHILPFYPYSSDDGFSVINYKQVNQALGEWSDIQHIASDFKLMADLVINHCSSRSEWFEQFKNNRSPEKDYFIKVDPATDLSQVTRPRTNPLLREVVTLDGTRHVWCTFSHDQIDLNFANPQLLLEMVSVIDFYLGMGISIFRLDAVAFLWKEIGSNCLNLPQTHEMIRLIRTLVEHKNSKAIIITETNIPNRENLAYFGNANEAHVIYNFTLPPLLLHGLLNGNSFHLNNWLMSMPPAQDGTTYLNFIASHDGIGLRPVEGILSDEEINRVTDTMQQYGARISWRNLADNQVRPYEINISLYDALSGTVNGPDNWQFERFMCAHAIMLSLEGIPAFYIHSLLGTENDLLKMEHSANNRSINRHVWDYNELTQLLSDSTSHHARVLGRLRQLIKIRTRQPAFHPNATQYTLHLGEGVFAYWRQSRSREQSIFCFHNISDQVQQISLSSVNLVATYQWHDLFSGKVYDDLYSTLQLQPYECVWLSNQ